MGYFVVYPWIIKFESGSMCSLKQTGRQDGFSVLNCCCYCSVMNTQRIILNELPKALLISGFLSSMNYISSIDNSAFFWKVLFFSTPFFGLQLTSHWSPSSSNEGQKEEEAGEGLRRLEEGRGGHSTSLPLPSPRERSSDK